MTEFSYLRRSALGRRELMLAGAAASVAGAAGAFDLEHTELSSVHHIDYAIMWHEKPIGEHRISLSRETGALIVRHDTKIEVSVLFISAISLSQTSTETWRDGQLRRIRSNLLRNDIRSEIDGELVGDAFILRNGAGEVATSPDLATADSFWLLSAVRHNNLLDVRTGEVSQWRKTPLGRRELTVGGAPTSVEGFRLDAGETHAELWYDGDFLVASDLKESGSTAHIELKDLS